MTRKSLKPLALSTLLLGGTALTLATSFALNNGENGTGTQNAPLHVQVDNSPLTRDVKEGNSFAPIVKKVAPSVVKIFVTMKEPAEVAIRSPIRTTTFSGVSLVKME